MLRAVPTNFQEITHFWPMRIFSSDSSLNPLGTSQFPTGGRKYWKPHVGINLLDCTSLPHCGSPVYFHNNLIVNIEINRIFYISTKRGGGGGEGGAGHMKGSKNPMIGLSQKKIFKCIKIIWNKKKINFSFF